VCIDKDKQCIREVNDGQMPLYESGLRKIVPPRASKRKGSLSPRFRGWPGVPRRGDRRALHKRGHAEGEDGSADLSSVAAFKNIDPDEVVERVPVVSS